MIAPWLVLALASSQAAEPTNFDIRPGPAAQAINRLAAQADIDVVVTANLAGRRTPGVSGRMSAEAALDQLVRPLGARAVRLGDGLYRIEAAPRTRPAPAAAAADPPPPVVLSELVVTAVPPVGHVGVAGQSLVDPAALERMEGVPASEAIADLSATVDSTRQGAGRNKLFVRGLADSAHNGPLQATVGQYLGELRLNYGSPDPDLALIDIRRIEVFEGPQGTRFGVGAIGGVLRLEPEPPALGETSARLVIGAGATSGGGASGDAALILNAPLGDRAAGRLVAWSRQDGGFLDNPGQGLRDVDRVDTIGARLSTRWRGGGWTVDILGVTQTVSAGDSQAVPVDESRLVRTGPVTEPYESSVSLAGITARRRFGAVNLSSATSASRQSLDERFDASGPDGVSPALVDRRQTALTASSELRLQTDPRSGWTWSGGAAIAVGETIVERRRRDLAPAPAPDHGVDMTRTFVEATAFGEASFAPDPDWRVALGARLSAVRIDSDLHEIGFQTQADRDERMTTRLTPSLSARWNMTLGTTLFARFEQAVRPAGVTEADGAFGRYRGDRVTLAEVGARSHALAGALSGEVSVGWVDWRDVQADIVTQGGDLVTDNVGNGVIRFLSLKAIWTPDPSLDVSGGVFINHSRLTPTRFSVIGGGRSDIPNVAPFGAQLSVGYEPSSIAGLPVRLGADLRYIGQSRLGVGPVLDVPQGGYLRTELTARLGDEQRAATLRLSNPFDTDGTRYGIGSPYQLTEPARIPVRPLMVRVTFDAAF